MYKINELLKQDQKLFHTNDLAVIWSTQNRNTLYTTIKRYIKRGILISVYKGLYSTVSIDKIDPLQLGVAIIHSYTYVTTETVLAYEGVISQTIYAYTYVSEKSQKLTINDQKYLFRKLKKEFLYRNTGIEEKNKVYTASLERAVADMLYFNPKYHFDVPGKIDWEKVRFIQKEVGYL